MVNHHVCKKFLGGHCDIGIHKMFQDIVMEVSYKVDHAVLEENYNLKNGYGILHCSWTIISMHAHVSVKAFLQGCSRVWPLLSE